MHIIYDEVRKLLKIGIGRPMGEEGKPIYTVSSLLVGGETSLFFFFFFFLFLNFLFYGCLLFTEMIRMHIQ